MQIKNLPNGVIIWYKDLICGVKGLTLEETYGNAILDATAYHIGNNPYDFELYPFSLPDRLRARIEEELIACQEED